MGNDEGGCRARRQWSGLGLRNRRDLRNTLLEVCGRLEEDFNHRDSVERLRLNVFDVVDSGSKVPLRNGNDPVAHVLWHETVIVPDTAADGNVNGRKNVRWPASNLDPPH